MALGPSDCSERAKLALIVGERTAIIQRVEKFFVEGGLSVEFYSDGQAALQRAQESLPEMVVSEILVPSLDGLGLCQALKSAPHTQDIRVLILSRLHAEDRALEAGADAFLLIPADEELLMETLGKLTAIRALRSVRERT